MNNLQKYKILVIFTLSEIIFYFKLNISNHSNYFLIWAIIGVAFLSYNILNVIKANPIISLFTQPKNKPVKIKSTFKERLYSFDTLVYLIFISMNFILYLIS